MSEENFCSAILNNHDIKYKGGRNKNIILETAKAYLNSGYPLDKILGDSENPIFCEKLMGKILCDKNEEPKTITNVKFCDEIQSLSELKNYTIRHYTARDPHEFKGTIKSNLTLSLDRYLQGLDSVLNTSGHTTSADWESIGNVGDTFYALFYDGNPATGITPKFIMDAKFYVEWSLEEFGDCWMSSDWLCSQNKCETRAFSGSVKDVIVACLLGQNSLSSAQLKFSVPELLKNPGSSLERYANFEVKKHGSMKFEECQIHKI